MRNAAIDSDDPGHVTVEATEFDTGRRAAERAGAIIVEAIAKRGTARVIFASAPSQAAMLSSLSKNSLIDWSRVQSFHMDEYLGLPSDSQRTFSRWLAERLPADAIPGFERIRTEGGISQEVARYGELVSAQPIDLTCLGVGVNGHIAFNEPGSDLSEPQPTLVVELDDRSRQQQVDEGLFPSIDDVPTHALTLSISALLSAAAVVCTAIGEHKAHAVTQALRGPASSTECPASALQDHRDVQWFLDEPAAAGLGEESVTSGT